MENGRLNPAHSPFSHSQFSAFQVVAFSHFLASYSQPVLRCFPTPVHRAFQRLRLPASRCRAMHLAPSPQCSTLGIHMHCNDLADVSLLRCFSRTSTLPVPATTRRFARRAPYHGYCRSRSRRATAPLRSTTRPDGVGPTHLAACGFAAGTMGGLLVRDGRAVPSGRVVERRGAVARRDRLRQ